MNTAAEMAHLGCQLFWGSPTCSGLCLHSAHCPRQRDKTSKATCWERHSPSLIQVGHRRGT